MGNLKIYYLYRDAGNYKQHGAVVLENQTGIFPVTLRQEMTAAFSASNLFPDVVSFNPAALDWPCLFFEKYDLSDDDVPHHELVGIEETDEAETNKMNAEELMAKLRDLVDRAAPFE